MNIQQARATPAVFNTFCGIYAVVCQEAQVVYVGQTRTNFLKRWEQHIQELKHGVHANDKLRAAFQEHGEKSLHFIIIEAAPSGRRDKQFRDWLDQREAFHIQAYGLANERG